MSQERTEKATPKKREDARKKGQVARGAELPGVLSLLGVIILLGMLFPSTFASLGSYIERTATQISSNAELTPSSIQLIFQDAAILLALVTLPILVLALVCVVIGNFAQGGLALSTEALKPKADRLNPVNNLKRVFGSDSIVNLAKSSIKLILIAAVAYTVLSPVVTESPGLMTAPVQVIASKLGNTLYTLAFRCGLVLLAFSGADYGYAWYKHEKSLRMSKQEIRDEFKEQEGDPMVKGQRRRAARALTQRRSLEAVPTASLVVTNPTHFAVALRYDPASDAAPIVVAKGADLVAAKIREKARSNDVPLIENPPLARALFRVVEPNQLIPAEFFGPVAELLAYVFRQKEKIRSN